MGYGDAVPKTWKGKVVASFCALLGISFFALPAVSRRAFVDLPAGQGPHQPVPVAHVFFSGHPWIRLCPESAAAAEAEAHDQAEGASCHPDPEALEMLRRGREQQL